MLAILAQAAAVRLLLTADPSRVYFLGRPVDVECVFRARFGVPCPGCGMTRSVVMALHGQFGQAWLAAPGGAVLVAALLAAAAGLAILTVLRAAGSPTADSFGLRFRRYALVAAGLVVSVWGAGWASSFVSAVHRHL